LGVGYEAGRSEPAELGERGAHVGVAQRCQNQSDVVRGEVTAQNRTGRGEIDQPGAEYGF
jgi:hypothetical protein